MTSIEEPANRRDSLIRSLRVLNAMEAKLQRIQDAQKEPIAVVGMGCRFPGGANDPDSFWELLDRAENTADYVPDDRWNIEYCYDPDPNAPGKTNTRFGNFILDPSPTHFDPNFFNISPREALSIDPQQRLLLEVTWEALEYGGISADKLIDSDTGVFIGISSHDYQLRAFENIEDTDEFRVTGNTASVASGRLSYFFGLHGPTFSIDTACSSALVALHEACHSLRSGECNLAIIGGVSLMYSHHSTIGFSKMGILSPDGKCKAFSDDADGIGRGEGCGVIIIKRLSDALKAHDIILALIRGSAVNHSGHSSGLSAPNSVSQQRVITKAMDSCGISPADISYVEAHGTGTPLGDAIEIGALEKVFGRRELTNPLHIGSVKTNIGHSEAASGMAALIKTILALNHEQIPQHLNVNRLNPIIPWDELPLQVTAKPEPWIVNAKPRYAGVNSFGLSGTNAHIILEGAERFINKQETITGSPLHILTLSAKNKPALRAMCQEYTTYLEEHPKSLADVAFTANTGRSHFSERIAVLGKTNSDIIPALEDFAHTEPTYIKTSSSTTFAISGNTFSNVAHQTAFIFTGYKTSLPILRMGIGLFGVVPAFTEILEETNRMFQASTGHSLIDLMHLYGQSRQDSTGKPDLLDHTSALKRAAFYGITTSIARLLMDLGVKPIMMLGEDLGLVSAAYIAGMVNFEAGIQYVQQNHSLPGGESFFDGLSGIKLNEPLIPVFDIIHGRILDKALNRTGDWSMSSSQQVQPDAAIQPIQLQEINVFLVFGQDRQQSKPSSTLKFDNGALWLTLCSKEREDSDIHTFYALLGNLYVNGYMLNWDTLYKGIHNKFHRLFLPTYPFQRQLYQIKSSGNAYDKNENLQNSQAALRTQESLFSTPPFNKVSFLKAPYEKQEHLLATIFRDSLARILNCDSAEINFNQSLYEIGVSSLMSLRLTEFISSYFGLPLGPAELYAKENINQIITSLTPTIVQYIKDVSNIRHIPEKDRNENLLEKLTTSHPGSRRTKIVQDPERSEIPDYVFILAAPRSGSTLLRVMLDNHSMLYAPPELNLLLFDNISDYFHDLSNTGWVDNLVRSVMRVKNISISQAQAQVDRWKTENTPTSEVYKQLKAWAGKTLVDKSPIYAYDLPIMQKIYNQKYTKVIVLSRHPYSSINSMIQSRLITTDAAVLDLSIRFDTHKRAEQQWSFLNRNILDFCEGLGNGNWIHVRYEDLVTNSHREMHRICAFLNVPFEESVLFPYKGDHDTTALPARATTGGDPNFNQYAEIDSRKGDEWRYIKLPHRLGGIARSVAAELDYTLPYELEAGFSSSNTLVSIPDKDLIHQKYKAIIEKHKKYDHPPKSISGFIVQILRKLLRSAAPSISYSHGLRIINRLAQNKLIHRLNQKHFHPAWQILEIINGAPLSAALRETWTANHLNFTLDWVLLKRLAFLRNPLMLTSSGLTHLSNAMHTDQGIILVGHHCQPLHLWSDFVRDAISAQTGAQSLSIGGLREILPDPMEVKQGQSKTAQRILVRQLQNGLNTLKNGGIIYIDGDGTHGSHTSLMLPCLGQQVPFMTGFAELALQTGAPVVPLTAVYTPSGQVELHYNSPLSTPSPSLSRDQRIQELVMQYVAILEAHWRKHPENIPLHICRIIMSLEDKE